MKRNQLDTSPSGLVNPLTSVPTEVLVNELISRNISMYRSTSSESEYKIKVGGEVVEHADGCATILVIKELWRD